MLAIQAVRAGGPEVLEQIQLPVPVAGPGQILVRHAAVGLNFIDTYQRSGLYPVPMPTVLGLEAAGVVEAVGEGVTRFRPNDRVAYGSGPLGAYAEMHVVPAHRAVKIPEGVAFDTAAAGLLKGMTAEFLLRRCYPVRAGETILVHAAAGGVGSILTQWAKQLGATVIGTVGTPEKAALAKSQGCDHTILYDDEDVAGQVKALTNGLGVPVVYDSVGATTFEATLGSLARRGLFVSFGNASGPPPALDIGRLSRAGSLFLTRPTLFDYVATTEELDASAEALFDVIAQDVVKIEIGQRFPLSETRTAHEALEARKTTGATVLIP
jgi:NADPH2:quinone reductase